MSQNLKIILLDHQNNYVKLVVKNMSKLYTKQNCLACLKFLRNYFDDPTELFLNLYVIAKFLDTSKSFFSCIHYINITRIHTKIKNAIFRVLRP